MLQLLQEDIKEIDSEFTMMTDYYNMLLGDLKSQNEDEIIIDTA